MTLRFERLGVKDARPIHVGNAPTQFAAQGPAQRRPVYNDAVRLLPCLPLRRAFPSIPLAVLLLAGAPACSSPPTQLLVVVNTDIVVPRDMRLVRATVRNLDNGEETFTTFSVNARGAAMTSEVELPFSFGVVPTGGDASRRVAVIIEGFRTDPSGTPIVTRRANTGFLEGKTLLLPMFLYASCVDVDCMSADLTCIDGRCESARADPAGLHEVVPGHEFDDAGATPITDGGGMDARLPDAGAPEGGTLDAGLPDAGPIDGGPTGCTDSAECDDHDPCNGVETCTGGECLAGTAPSCDDGVTCTVDSCSGSGCQHVTNDGACTAGPGGRCDVMLDCQYTTCDGATCTAGPCQSAMCDAGGVCRRMTTCAAGEMCCGGTCAPAGCNDGNPCTIDSCETTGCLNAPNTAACDDGDYCTINDRCMDRSCAPGTTPRDCDDGNPCNGAEYCSGACNSGVPLTCDDGVTCTVDSCDTSTGCIHAPSDAACSAAAGGYCDPVLDCQYPSCTAATCMPEPSLCQTATCMGDMCVRETLCAGSTPSCCAGACVALGCDDSNECTNDSCGGGGCVNTFNTNACDDGDACTTPDQCSGGLCTPGPARDCTDSDPCTSDYCMFGACFHGPEVGPCDDGVACTSFDMCSGGVCIGTDTCGMMSCGTQYCDAPSGVCMSSGTATSCFIDSACWSNGMADPSNTCHYCDSGMSPTAWTTQAMDTPCTAFGAPGCCDPAGSCVPGTCGIRDGGFVDAGWDAGIFTLDAGGGLFDSGTLSGPG